MGNYQENIQTSFEAITFSVYRSSNIHDKKIIFLLEKMFQTIYNLGNENHLRLTKIDDDVLIIPMRILQVHKADRVFLHP